MGVTASSEWRFGDSVSHKTSLIGNGSDLGYTQTDGCGAPDDAGILLPLKIFYGPKARLNNIEEAYRLLWSKYFKNLRNYNIFRYSFFFTNFGNIWADKDLL